MSAVDIYDMEDQSVTWIDLILSAMQSIGDTSEEFKTPLHLTKDTLCRPISSMDNHSEICSNFEVHTDVAIYSVYFCNGIVGIKGIKKKPECSLFVYNVKSLNCTVNVNVSTS